MWKRSIALKSRIDLFSLYDLFCERRFQENTPLSFHKSCAQMHGNKTECEWSSSVRYYHMTYTGKTNKIHDTWLFRGTTSDKIYVRWLDRVFQGQYLPSFSINYVAIKKKKKKLSPQLYWMQMKVPFDQGYNDIRVAIATKWRHYLFYLPYFSALRTLLQNHLPEVSPPIPTSMFVKFKRNMIYKIVEIFWDEVFMIRNTLKIRQSWCSAIISGKRSAFEMQFHLIIVLISDENVCEGSWR